MPTYEYACTECGDHTEVVQSISDARLTTCTVCGGRLRKVFSPVGVVFKGSGFYRTDSRAAANGSKTDKAATGSGESGSSDSSAKSDSSAGATKSSGSDGGSSAGSASSNGSSSASKAAAKTS